MYMTSWCILWWTVDKLQYHRVPGYIEIHKIHFFILKRRWCSGIMQDSHSCDPGSIPGRRKFLPPFTLFKNWNTNKKKVLRLISFHVDIFSFTNASSGYYMYMYAWFKPSLLTSYRVCTFVGFSQSIILLLWLAKYMLSLKKELNNMNFLVFYPKFGFLHQI